MNKNLLIVLAYNEENNIQETIVELIDQFDEILIVNDLSTDNTKKIISDLTKVYKNIKVLENPKNYGAGKSFQQAIEYIKNTKNDFENIVKIDGDGQFEKKDIFLVKKLLEKEKSQFIKSNRFWKSGIVGDIPTVRYLGNSIASFAIKFNTGLFLINDPLNGLFGFKKSFLTSVNIPKIFNRYGYPFYINTISVQQNVKTTEVQNTVKYNIGEKSQLKAIPMLFKLFVFSARYFFTNLKLKLKNSNLQTSAVLDLFFLLFQLNSYFSIYKLFEIRIKGYSGVQSNWLILFVIFQLFSYVIIYYGKVLENRFRKNFFRLNE
ncbi:glycosyltransferase family 2 protein [Acidimicrobiia bacterium]|nr:glycosyltransferase family 2 protein [Acidimicrobiia bacterium]